MLAFGYCVVSIHVAEVDYVPAQKSLFARTNRRLCLSATCISNFLRQHFPRRHSADSDDGGVAVYVQRAAGLHRRLQPVDEAGGCHLPDRLHADYAPVSGAADLRGQYAAGAWHHAGSQRSAAHRAAVRSGQFGQSQHDVRHSRHHHGGQSHPLRRKGGKLSVGVVFKKCQQSNLFTRTISGRRQISGSGVCGILRSCASRHFYLWYRWSSLALSFRRQPRSASAFSPSAVMTAPCWISSAVR